MKSVIHDLDDSKGIGVLVLFVPKRDQGTAFLAIVRSTKGKR